MLHQGTCSMNHKDRISGLFQHFDARAKIETYHGTEHEQVNASTKRQRLPRAASVTVWPPDTVVSIRERLRDLLLD